MAKWWGCLGLLAVLLVITGEVALAWLLGEMWEDVGGLGALIVLAILTVVGVQLVRSRSKALPQAVMQGRPGEAMVGIIAAFLIAFPGFVTAALGGLLLIPFIQRRFTTLAQRLFLRLVAKAAGQMGQGGGFPGMPPGAMAGGMPPGFDPSLIKPEDLERAMAQMRAMGGGMPGNMQPDEMLRAMQQMQKARAGGRPKTYDVKAEKGTKSKRRVR